MRADLYDAQGVGWGYAGDIGDAAWIGRASIDDAGFSLGDIGRAISGAVHSVEKAVGGAAKSVGSWVHEHDPIGHIAMQIARGERVDKAFAQGAKLGVETIKEAAPYIQTALSVIPGIGQGVSMALGAAIALASGAPISEAMIAAAVAAVPGGPLAQRAMQAGLTIASNLAAGKRLDQAAMEAVRAQVPGGQAGKAAFDAGVAIMSGKKIQEAASKALGTLGQGVLPGGRFGNAAINAASDVLAGHRVDRAILAQGIRAVHSVALSVPIPSAVGSLANQLNARKALGLATGVLGVPRISSPIGDALAGGVSHVVDSRIGTVAKALLARPELRALPVYDLAKRLGVSEDYARRGMASVLDAVKKVGAIHAPLVLPRLAHAPELARLLGDSSFDQGLARFASRVAPVSYSASPATFVSTPALDRIRWRGMNRNMLEHIVRRVPAMRALTPTQIRALSLLDHSAVKEASGLDTTGTKYVVESGDFPTKIAQKLVKNGNRWRELVAANPQKATDADGNFKSLLPGEVLNLPVSWLGGMPPTPLPSTPTPPQLPPGPTPPTSGLVASGKYVVQSGDFPVKIAQKLVNDGRRWPELVAANPQKATGADGNFKSLLPGEVLTLPASWVGGTQPTPGPLPAPQRGFDARVLQVQGMLGLWSAANDASNPARFGSNPTRDADGVFGPRTQGAMAKFQKWANANMGKGLRTDGVIDDPSYQALVEWTANQTPTLPSSPTVPSSPGSLPSLPVPQPVIGPSQPPHPAPASKSGGDSGMGIAIAGVAALLLLGGDKK